MRARAKHFLCRIKKASSLHFTSTLVSLFYFSIVHDPLSSAMPFLKNMSGSADASYPKLSTNEKSNTDSTQEH